MFNLRRPAAILTAAVTTALAATLALSAPASALPTYSGQPLERVTFASNGDEDCSTPNNSVTLGLNFQVDTPGVITGVEFLRSSGVNNTSIVTIWNSAGGKVAEAGSSTSAGGASGAPTGATGLVHAWFYEPVPVNTNTTYTVSYFSPSGCFNLEQGVHGSATSDGHIQMPINAGKFTYATGGPTFPTSTFNGSDYKVTPVFVANV